MAQTRREFFQGLIQAFGRGLMVADPIGAPNNYASHKMGGFTFDASGDFWLADWKRNGSPERSEKPVCSMKRAGAFRPTELSPRPSTASSASSRRVKTTAKAR